MANWSGSACPHRPPGEGLQGLLLVQFVPIFFWNGKNCFGKTARCPRHRDTFRCDLPPLEVKKKKML